MPATRSTIDRIGRRLIVLLCLLSFSSAAFAHTRDQQTAELQPSWQQQTYELRSVIRPIQSAQANQRNNFRTRSEVVREVKRRFNARVLKISLNRKRAVYNVRILLPNGKVRNLQVSARR